MLRAHYREKRDVMVAALRSELGDASAGRIRVADSSCGPDCRSRSTPIACSIARVAHGVVYVAGEAFFVNGRRWPSRNRSGDATVRLAFAATHARIREGVSRLAAAIHEELGELNRSGPVAQQAR